MNDLQMSVLLDRYARDGENTINDVFRRVSNHVGQSQQEQQRFYEAMSNQRFIPAGRILAADQDRTYYNCYVLPSPKDSRGGITETLYQLLEIQSRGGGVGINLSSLRPRGAIAKKVGGASSGAVSWGGLYSYATGLVSQGGSRRGATMLILDDWHPDVLEFIDSKREAGKITNANISVGFSNEFMSALENDLDWNLVFPDTSHEEYDEIWDGNLESWKLRNLPVIHYKTVKARDLWNRVIESAWSSAEPGIWFKGRTRDMSNSWYYADIISTNPCSEIPLSAWGVCCLGHINLSKMLIEKNGAIVIDWVSIINATKTAVHFLDNVIDITPYHFEENEHVQKGERRIGIGTMGFAELLIRLGIRYGSDESVELADKIQSIISTTAYMESSDIALEKGSFPQFDEKKFLASGYMQQMPDSLRAKIHTDGIRNAFLLTQAPTGTVGTMLNTSTGIEPFFSFKHYRKTRMGVFEETHPIIDGLDKLEDYHVTAMDGSISPEEHIKVMAAFQRWIDNSISKTVNLPHEATVEDVSSAYTNMYKLGCKGGTVYRDGSRDEQVLSLNNPDADNDKNCPDCGSKLVSEDGCHNCHDCGYSACSI